MQLDDMLASAAHLRAFVRSCLELPHDEAEALAGGALLADFLTAPFREPG